MEEGGGEEGKVEQWDLGRSIERRRIEGRRSKYV